MYPDVSGKTLFIHKLIHAYPGVCIYIYIYTDRLTQIICSALCHTHAVVNLPTADVLADLTLT